MIHSKRLILKVALLVVYLGVAFATYPNPYGHHDYHHRPQPYKFGYGVKDFSGAHFRKEHGDGLGGVKGSYGYIDPLGMQREVHYVADHHGFRAKIKTNEPGTASQDPAHVQLLSNPMHISYSSNHGFHHG